MQRRDGDVARRHGVLVRAFTLVPHRLARDPEVLPAVRIDFLDH